MSIRNLITAAGALAIVAGTPMALSAQNERTEFQADQAFVNQVAAMNLLEVRLGQQAQAKAQTPRVKQFADKVVGDHTEMQKLWMERAREHGVSFNARLDTEQQSNLTRLGGLSGRDFEVAYMDLMVQDHQKALHLFQTEGRSARSQQVRGLVEYGLPMLTEHSRLAVQIRGELDQPVAAGQPQPGDTQAAAGAPSPWSNVKPEKPRAQNQRDDDVSRPPSDRETTANANANRGGRNGRLNTSDAEFVRNVVQHHFLEQRLADLAAKKARNKDVKEYVERTKRDHAELEKEWIKMARDNGMTINAGMGPNHRSHVEKLERKSDRAFDREYMSMEVANHEWYINELIRDGRNAPSAVRNLARRSSEKEMEHLNRAKRVGAKVGANTDANIKYNWNDR